MGGEQGVVERCAGASRKWLAGMKLTCGQLAVLGFLGWSKRGGKQSGVRSLEVIRRTPDWWRMWLGRLQLRMVARLLDTSVLGMTRGARLDTWLSILHFVPHDWAERAQIDMRKVLGGKGLMGLAGPD